MRKDTDEIIDFIVCYMVDNNLDLEIQKDINLLHAHISKYVEKEYGSLSEDNKKYIINEATRKYWNY